MASVVAASAETPPFIGVGYPLRSPGRLERLATRLAGTAFHGVSRPRDAGYDPRAPTAAHTARAQTARPSLGVIGGSEADSQLIGKWLSDLGSLAVRSSAPGDP